MNIFEKTKIELLKKKIETYKLKAHNNDKFSLFDASFAKELFSRKDTNYRSLESIYEMISSWEEKCNIPYDFGVALDQVASEEVVMIHRTNLNFDKDSEGLQNNDVLYNIMNDGLVNTGHLHSSGTITNGASDLTLTMTPLKGLSGYINLVSSYKSNDTTIIAAFPKDLVDEDGHIKDMSRCCEIYDVVNDQLAVKPKFLRGAILKKNNGLDEFYDQQEILQVMENNKEKNVK